MKDKILEKVYHKISETFGEFLPREKFEQELKRISPLLSKRVSALKKEYDALLEDDGRGKAELIKISRQGYIDSHVRYDYLGKKDKSESARLGRVYDGLWADKDESIVRPFYDWLTLYGKEVVNFECERILKEHLWRGVRKLRDKSYSSEIGMVVDLEHGCKSNSEPAMSLMEMREKYLGREEVPPRSSWVINAFKPEGYSSKEHLYVRIFLLLSAKNELVVLEMDDKSLQRKSIYHIAHDIQKADLIKGNTVVAHLNKYFEPEKIVFDTEEEAFTFYQKLSDIRVGRVAKNAKRR